MLGILALLIRPWPLTMKGMMVLIVIRMNRIEDEVTSVRAQLLVKATTTEATIVALYSTKTPSFSEMPSWSTLLVDVIVPVAWPGDIESRTWMLCPKRHWR